MPSLTQTTFYKKSDTQTQQNLLNFENEGYAILKNFLDENTVNKINDEIDFLSNERKIKQNAKQKIMFAIHKSDYLKSIGQNKSLPELLSSRMYEGVKLFQSINFIMGSQQNTHSDSIHMTTFPLGGLMGFWIALEDIDADNGPLHYYPQSHKLPYYLNSDYDNEGNTFLIGDKNYSEYEKMIEQKIQVYEMKKLVFTAKKGDAIIWHVNLFHGREPHLDR